MVMTILQHYYTSCTGKGFQTNAVSDGLDKDIITILPRLGLYKPSLSMSSQPTIEELKNFPISFSYHILHDKKAVITNSVYIGKDYSNRFGNYFSHSIITDNYNEDMYNLLPIQLWGSPVWVAKESPTEILPPLDSVKAGSLIKIENVNNFLASDNRLSRLPYLISATLNSLKKRKKVIIVDDNQNIALWIAAISMGLPYDLSKQITFTTYNKDPYNVDTLICGTTIDSDFRFSPQEIKFEYSVFDFEGNRFSEIEEIDPYIEKVCDLFKYKKNGILNDFSIFYGEAVALAPTCQYDLHGLYSIFSAVHGLAISEDEWGKVIHLIISNNLINLNPNLVQRAIPLLGNVSSAGKKLAVCIAELNYKISSEKIDPFIKLESAKALFNIVFLRYLPTASVSELEEILGKTKDIRLEMLQKEYELKCQEILHGINDVNKKIYLFQYFINTGLITSKSVHLESLLEHGIMPTIAESATQKLFEDNLNTEFQKPFIIALGNYLSEKLKENKIHADLSNLITNELIYTDLVSYSIRHNNISMYLYLYNQYVQSKREKVNLFLDFYRDLSKFKSHLGLKGLETAFSNTWITSIPSFEEVYSIVEAIALQDLAQCSFADIFAEIVYKNTNFTSISKKSIKLANTLLNSPRLSDRHRIILNAITKIPNLKGNEVDLKILYDIINSEPFDTNKALHRNMLELFFRKLIIENMQQKTHRFYVAELTRNLSKSNPVYYNAYMAAFDYAVSKKPNDINVFVDCFKVWEYLGSTGSIPAKNNFLYVGYKKAFYSQEKKIRKLIENKICNDTHFRKNWEIYKEKTETGFVVSVNRISKKLKRLVQK